MTVNDLYRKFLRELSEVYPRGEAAGICSIVFEHFAGITRSAVIKEPARILDAGVVAMMNKHLEALLQHMPVQYITGEAWFCDMQLKVSPAVLIPRPETEELVREVLAFIAQKQNAAVLDIGTGSGCIAIAIKKNAAGASVDAIDISTAALDIARENAAAQKTTIRFRETDILDINSWQALASYDVIVSNPPYIPVSEKQSLHKNVTAYEPHRALFVADAEPLLFYKQIAAIGKGHLQAGGKIFMETHADYAVQVASFFRENGYDAVVLKDMFEKNRMVTATRSR
jgi:release factor glutamine methyltransferase